MITIDCGDLSLTLRERRQPDIYAVKITESADLLPIMRGKGEIALYHQTRSGTMYRRP